MNKPIFNSQVCTTVEQSNRLLELGVKPETADCHYLLMDDNWSMGFGFWKQPHQNVPTHYIPAWSLHRLLELCPDCQTEVGNRYATFYYQEWSMDAEDFQVFENAYDNVIECIMWLISKGYFNKEYLNK